jgi:hypothetical protein
MGKRRAGGPLRKAGWQQWTADEARQVVEAWRASGLSLAAFARERGLIAERVRWWSKRLGDWGPAKGEEVLQFAPVVVRDLRPIAATPGGGVSLRLAGGVVIEVADVATVPAAWVSALVKGLARPAP